MSGAVFTRLQNCPTISRAELELTQQTLESIESQLLTKNFSWAGVFSLSAIASSYLTLYYFLLREEMPNVSEMMAAAASLGGSTALLIDRCYEILSPQSSSHQLETLVRNTACVIQALLSSNPDQQTFNQNDLAAIRSLLTPPKKGSSIEIL